MTLAEIIERLEKATEGSREIDRALHVLLHRWKLAAVGPDYDGQNASEVYTSDGKLIPDFGYPPLGKIDPYFHVPDWPSNQYTRNTDSAIRLVRFWAPKWVGPICITECGSTQVGLDAREPCDPRAVQVVAPTPALALCLALCRALQAQETPHDE
jgi:hypothetical protein